MRREPDELLRWCAEQMLAEPVGTDERLLAEVFRAGADAWPVDQLQRDGRDRRLVYAVVGLARWFEGVDEHVDEPPAPPSRIALPERAACDPWQQPPAGTSLLTIIDVRELIARSAEAGGV